MTGLVASGAGELHATLNKFVKESRFPGVIAGVVHGDELAWVGETGFADTGFADTTTQTASQPGTLYRIASITKTFTGTAIMQLRDAGRLSLDDPAVDYLPELRGAISPFAPIEAVTLRRMLSHESGLATEPPGTDWSVPVYQGEPGVSLAHPDRIVLMTPPNAQHKYSDLAYQLLGEIVTRVSGIPYPRYMRERILDPLGLAATAFEPLATPLLNRRATGYDWRALSDELTPARSITPVWAEGGLWSCVDDMARWISFQLRAYTEPATDSPVLAAASRREMHKPRYLADDGWTRAWGISWYGNRRDDIVWIQHSGGLPGFTTTVCFDPGTGVGAIVLANGTGSVEQLAYDLAATARRLVRAAPPVITTPAIKTPAQYRPLLGLYARPDLGGWVLRLEWRDGQLAFTSPDLPSWRLALEPTGNPDVFIAEPGSTFSGENVTFRRREAGREAGGVLSVLLVESTYLRLAPPG